MEILGYLFIAACIAGVVFAAVQVFKEADHD